jgi:hypothetical protein
LTLAGLEDVTAKFIGSTNPVNCARATFQALKMIQSPDHIMRLRKGEKVDKHGKFVAETMKSAAEEAIADFSAEEEAAKRETEERLSKPKSADQKTPATEAKEQEAKGEESAPKADSSEIDAKAEKE